MKKKHIGINMFRWKQAGILKPLHISGIVKFITNSGKYVILLVKKFDNYDESVISYYLKKKYLIEVPCV